jgi:uncharacterized membrane protein
MKGLRIGVGIVFGAAYGQVFGQMLFDDWWLGPAIGTAAGLIVGAMADLRSTSEDPRPRPPIDLKP